MNIRKLMKEKVSRVSISSKMSIVMTVSIVLILTVFLGVNRYYNSFFVYQKLENASLTYLDSIDRMMENLVDTLDGYSRICFSNAGVQELLDKNSSGQVDFSLQDNVNNYLWELVVNVKQIESIYLYSNNGLVASADRQELHYPRYRCIKDYEWYDEEEYGEYHVDFSSDDFYRKGDMPEISFRRAVRSTTNFKKIGYMIMTVSSDVLKDFLVADNADKYERVFCLLNNEESVIVISDNVYMDEMQKIGKDMIQNEKAMVLRNMFDEKYMFCILKSEEGYYMDAISVEDAYQRNREKSLVDIALIILQAMLTLVCIVMISKLYTLLGVLGLESLQRSWLGDVNTALFSAFVPIIWQNVGYHMLLLYTSINSISKDILEAAKLDGASGVKAARYITIPLVKPMLRTCAIFVVIGSLKAFDMIYVLTNGGPAHMTEVPSSLMFSSIFNLNKYGYGSAISIFIVVECIVMAVILQKVFLVKEESA